MFYQCSSCGAIWYNRHELLSDPEVVLIGYQVHFKKWKTGFLIFNHLQSNCQTTFSISLNEFSDLLNKEIFVDINRTGCPGFCLRGSDIGSCAGGCECSFVKEIMEIINSYPKTSMKTIEMAVSSEKWTAD